MNAPRTAPVAWIDRRHAERQMSAKEWAEHVAKCEADKAKWIAKFTKPRTK